MILFYFMLILKTANKNNKNYLYIYPTKKVICFVLLLFNTGFIAGFSLLNHNIKLIFVLKIFLKYNNSVKKSIKKIAILSSLNTDIFISFNKCCLINGNIFFISTIFGNMSTNNSKLLNSGGKLTFYLS